MKIPEYLGKHVSILLEEVPFKNWPVEKSIEDDLEEKLTSYMFKEHGFEVSCDRNDKISVIFLYSDKYNGFAESLFEIPFSWNQKQVLEHFGVPSKSGGKVSDPILGDYGPWDRFTRPGYAIHVRYRTDSDRIKQITLMRSDVVP
jgi:hypothetical protein